MSVNRSILGTIAVETAAGEELTMDWSDETAIRDGFGDDTAAADTEVRRELEQLKQSVDDQAAQKRTDNAPFSVDRNRPSSGQITGHITIHMRQIYGHVLGRRRSADGKHSITGLYGFGAGVRTLEQAYKADCPYAAWKLVQIEQQIESVRQQLAERQKLAQDLIATACPGIAFESFTARRPAQIPLTFVSAYSYQVASVLTTYDKHLRAVYPYVHTHFISNVQYTDVSLSVGRRLRGLLRLPQNYVFVGKDAVAQKTAVYYAAIERMGELPQDYIAETVKPAWVR